MRDGVKVKIGDAEYVVPRLTVGSFKRLSAVGATTNEANATDVLLEQVAIVLRGNYPEITAEVLQEAVFADELLDVHRAVLAAAGVKKSAEGEAPSP